MGKKRKHFIAQGEENSQDKKHKTSNKALLPDHGNSDGVTPVTRKTARAWLSVELKHLKELKNDPELQSACSAIAGLEYVKNVMSWSEDLEALQVAFQPDTPPAGELEQGNGGATSSPPPPPEIRDARLAQQTFTHRSMITDPVLLHSNNADYERLEFIGDSYLYPMCAEFVSERYPNANPGKLATLRQELLQNESLAHFSRLYGFDKKLKIQPDAARSMQGTTKSWTKILGDIFEAYVAAVILSRPEDGWKITEQWLRKLWATYLPEKDLVDPSSKSAKLELGHKVLSLGIKLSYEEMQPPRPTGPGQKEFTIGAFLSGWGWKHVLLGEGKGCNKSEAGSAAALQALRNPVTETIGNVKKSFEHARKQELEREGGPREGVLEALDKKWK